MASKGHSCPYSLCHHGEQAAMVAVMMKDAQRWQATMVAVTMKDAQRWQAAMIAVMMKGE